MRGAVRHMRSIDGYATNAALPSDLVAVGEVDGSTDWERALDSVDVVVHLAARVHVMRETRVDLLSDYRCVNVGGSLNLARQAALVGVRRFIFVSSIKVNGDGTEGGRPYAADDSPAPSDPYSISKYEAEIGLSQISLETPLEVAIIRPPLVYGPGVKANFLSLARWLRKGLPLPLGAIDNRRSFVGVDNLADLIVATVCNPAAANQTFLVSDGEDLSTTDLLQRLGLALGKPARLIPVPAAVVMAGAALIGQDDMARRLLGSLEVDISKTRRVLNWEPPFTVDEQLEKMALHLLASSE